MSTKRFLGGLSQNALDDLGILASNIAEARKVRGFSQREMAARCLMALSTYQAVEKGDPAVSIGAILAVLDLLDMTEGLRDVAAPHLDSHGRAVRASKRRY
jgi:transcriptional regulator with XRE-family HTH domain